ncbi:MAG: tetratricopeptide repeat protein [Chlorobi bacterium]|nr:tetratricopeptide repeat protein [Chlorobiota bacterium]
MKAIFGFPLALVLLFLISCGHNPEKSDELVEEGISLLYKGKNDAALSSFEEAIRYNPENFEAYFYKGNCLANKKKYREAIDEYTKAIKIKPDFARAYANRGEMMFYLGDEERACLDWKKAESLGMIEMLDKTRGCR